MTSVSVRKKKNPHNMKKESRSQLYPLSYSMELAYGLCKLGRRVAITLRKFDLLIPLGIEIAKLDI